MWRLKICATRTDSTVPNQTEPDFDDMNTSHKTAAPFDLRFAALISAFVLSACGGGGGGGAIGGAADGPSVSAAELKVDPKYGQKLVLAVNGAGLDKVGATGSGCNDFSLNTAAPYISNASTAYFQCSVTAVGAAQIVLKRASDGATLWTFPLNVPAPQVTMTFSNGAGVGGNVVVTLAPDKTPITVDNFLRYVNAGFYNGTVVHRVVPRFIVQAGGYEGVFSGDARAATIPAIKASSGPIALEVNKGLSNTQWTIAMDRVSPDQLNSASTQFFFNLVDNIALDPNPTGFGHAVFGAVTPGTTATVAAIANPALAPCVPLLGFSTAPDCTPIPNVVLTSAVQTR